MRDRQCAKLIRLHGNFLSKHDVAWDEITLKGAVAGEVNVKRWNGLPWKQWHEFCHMTLAN
ncbi:hypothetical protein XH99_22095 [Bradyrhizobium nanningense]|uniref:Uncharacterized protein n=1 Tax=Bradyrhizobium nanningense TaxID=1325118 RepID=A0A4Q0S134_9BRAD|nr:hypothetical protein XH99_22095 [Bradyrhizobium nanningense]RXH29884.1 hypothetical protein XH84_20080 [Bradyrhizobium nanningense]